MRPLAVLLITVICVPRLAGAEDEPPTSTIRPVQPPTPPPPASPTPTPPPGSTSPPGSTITSGTPGSPPSGTSITTIPSTQSTSLPPGPSLVQPRMLTPNEASRWNTGRNLYGAGSFIGLAGSALTIASVIVSAVTGFPCYPHDPLQQSVNPQGCDPMQRPAQPTDAVPLMAYIGSSTSAFGFILTAGGLAYQHWLLRDLGGDPVGRGLFAGGTILGVLGFAAVGASYGFGLTDSLQGRDQGIAILASTITGTVLCTLGSLLYTIDASRTKRAWHRHFTF